MGLLSFESQLHVILNNQNNRPFYEYTTVLRRRYRRQQQQDSARRAHRGQRGSSSSQSSTSQQFLIMSPKYLKILSNIEDSEYPWNGNSKNITIERMIKKARAAQEELKPNHISSLARIGMVNNTNEQNAVVNINAETME